MRIVKYYVIDSKIDDLFLIKIIKSALVTVAIVWEELGIEVKYQSNQ